MMSFGLNDELMTTGQSHFVRCKVADRCCPWWII